MNQKSNTQFSSKSPEFQDRFSNSALDFIKGVKPALEKQLGIKIMPVEDQGGELARQLDQYGIDAFYYDECKQVRGLGSRVNYHSAAAFKPSFSFRYALYDHRKQEWDDNREYKKKLFLSSAPPDQFVLFPKLHVESFSEQKGSGLITWSYAVRTKDVLEFIKQNIDNPALVTIFTPKVGELRKVVSVRVEVFGRFGEVVEVGVRNSKNGN